MTIHRVLSREITLNRAAAIVGLLAFATLCVCCSRSTERKPTTPAPGFAVGQVLTGRVVRVADGDTVTILDSNNAQHRIRLQGIDAPESHQAFGTQSKQSLSQLIFDKDVTVEYEKIDRYGRIVGKIILDGTDIDLEQIKAGMAWHYKDYEDEQTPTDRDLYARAEDEARNARRGLWVDANPIEPSEYRREQKRQREDAR
jgi:endonuclease YncB( thermonuclease family)